MEVDQLNPNARTQVLKDCLQQGLIQINGLSGHFAFVPQIHLRWTNVWMDMVQLFPQIKQIILNNSDRNIWSLPKSNLKLHGSAPNIRRALPCFSHGCGHGPKKLGRPASLSQWIWGNHSFKGVPRSHLILVKVVGTLAFLGSSISRK